MRATFNLSGENVEIALAEVRAALEAESIKYCVLNSSDAFFDVFCSREELHKASARLGLCHGVYAVFSNIAASDFSMPWLVRETKELAQQWLCGECYTGKAATKFAVKCVSLCGYGSIGLRSAIEAEVGAVIKRLTNMKVDLNSPDVLITAIFGKNVYLGMLLTTIDRKKFDARAHGRRPFNTPVSLHPKFARAVVNLARAKRNKVFLDPFCGTGAIVMEAADMGAHAVGCDINEAMIHGALENLKFYNLDAKIFRCNASHDLRAKIAAHVTNATGAKISAIGTDPPYGRSSLADPRNMEKLYSGFFSNAQSILESKAYISIIFANPKWLELAAEYFDVVEVYKHRVHKSLTRHFCVLRNK